MSTIYQFEDDGFRDPRKQPSPLGSEVDLEPCESASTVIGQEQAIARLRGVVSRYRWARQAGRTIEPVLLLGPVGVGKTESMRQVASTTGLPLVEIHLPAARHRDEIRSLALTGLLNVFGARTLPSSPSAIVLVDDLLHASPEMRQELAYVLRDPCKISYRHRGAKAELDLTGLLWVSNLSYWSPDPDDDHIALVYRELPPILLDSVRHRIVFKALGREELFRVMAESSLSPTRQLADGLSEALGTDVDFSENALWTIVDRAIAHFPEAGARGLLQEVAELELGIWAAATEGEHHE